MGYKGKGNHAHTVSHFCTRHTRLVVIDFEFEKNNKLIKSDTLMLPKIIEIVLSLFAIKFCLLLVNFVVKLRLRTFFCQV